MFPIVAAFVMCGQHAAVIAEHITAARAASEPSPDIIVYGAGR